MALCLPVKISIYEKPDVFASFAQRIIHERDEVKYHQDKDLQLRADKICETFFPVTLMSLFGTFRA
jgi:hypothetical protein